SVQIPVALPAISLTTVLIDEESVPSTRHEIPVAIEIDVASPHPAWFTVASIVEVDVAAEEPRLRVWSRCGTWCRHRIHRHVSLGGGW
ncbi:MAG: hypothetical protein WBQ30_06280, partial [Thermoanaerobaculia bacterium]